MAQAAAGSNSSLTGQSPALAVEEMQSGRPSYTASYQPTRTGAYQVAVTQLLPGGLSATYWDNQWLVGATVVQRVDAQVCLDAVSSTGRTRFALYCCSVL